MSAFLFNTINYDTFSSIMWYHRKITILSHKTKKTVSTTLLNLIYRTGHSMDPHNVF